MDDLIYDSICEDCQGEGVTDLLGPEPEDGVIGVEHCRCCGGRGIRPAGASFPISQGVTRIRSEALARRRRRAFIAELVEIIDRRLRPR